MRHLLVFTLGLYLALPALADQLLIATATNFKPALVDISESFQAQSGHSVSISSASTGVLYNQILHGAPFHIFLAADSQHPELLEHSGQAIAQTSFTYAWGQLVLAYREELAPLAARGPGELLQKPGLSLVIANPDHAPYGRAAMAVLQKRPLNPDHRLLRATNVGQAYQMWYSGGADAALVALSSSPAHYLEVPANWYSPLQQQAVLLQRGENLAAATQFLHYLASDQAQEVIRKHGYATEAPGHG
jgi:molybdate transport system substrate-binding protein